MHLGNQVDAAAVGQAQVHQRQRNGLAGQAGARLGQGAREDQRVGLIAQLQQQAFDAPADQRFVLHQQHGGGQREFGGKRGGGHRWEGEKAESPDSRL
ncbi:hypothetical protein D3C78_1496290 [compost metagenome]